MITMTELASRKTLNSLNKRGKGLGIKVGIFVDPKHIPYLNGMEIDWKRNGLNEGFDFINSLEKNRCGCGESFNI